ncbi:flavodoxin reductase [Meridianimarinicoccus aquatilis]|uniref:Flavodoxin reductase n=1 Tax=Meridianimarinicoccus aquatilis TaxID=2552766 RepID=A0A4R6B3H6_9RHOB|nr:flavodoxin reductase [Fluviibacterium aquatile]TDL90835.1 flavodoxin reductase [Fluviibacterium aquatile]
MRYEIFLEELESLTPSVRRLRFNKPDDFTFEPGQATDLALTRDGWRNEVRPFTFTSLPSDPFLEFTIKSYPSHDGVTKQIPHLEKGESVTIGSPWGAIADKGPGFFIAGGAGVTPFIPILRNRSIDRNLDGCTLVLADQSYDALILRDEWRAMTGLRTEFVVSEGPREDSHSGKIDDALLSDLGIPSDARVYLCGPPPMEDAVAGSLNKIGITEGQIIREQ